ncbi:hypothetical protein AMS68_000046 [Peltaster fructicola]|uniref:Uncharacterized protein n=1 Tax=Peltaster fructicola TaxID=286661 RepID=A0A6H0XIR3_9PEZI|nr:hypothetical protein AMS68_000046 [Peltaster fructicola]
MEPHPISCAIRPETIRSQTWPHTSPVISIDSSSSKHIPLFDFDDHPGDHFLSPMQMYEDYDDWSSDSDDDADEVEWNAGITDFALFERDRQQAKAAGKSIPEKWGAMLSSQEAALDRAVERSRNDGLARTPSTESIPDLTPDNSPHLRDDLEVGSYPPPSQSAAPRPAYLASFNAHEDDIDLSFYVPRRSHSSPVIHTMGPKRPGLRDGRTLSGKEHVWRRPGWDIFTVREDPAAELKAEKGSIVSQERQHAAVADFQLALSR